jgi:hypothetical protein
MLGVRVHKQECLCYGWGCAGVVKQDAGDDEGAIVRIWGAAVLRPYMNLACRGGHGDAVPLRGE